LQQLSELRARAEEVLSPFSRGREVQVVLVQQI
jgi:hypothetical protein